MSVSEQETNHKKNNVKEFTSEDENVERGNWTNQLDFILACLGYAVGLGNVWRFPYLTFKHGGGAFLIPYVVMLVGAGLPMFFLELAVGQYSSYGPISLFSRMSPMFKGIGVAPVIVSVIVSTYYQVIIAWAIFYMFSSLTSVLPWENCDHWWNTEYCTQAFNAWNNCTDTTPTSSEDWICYKNDWVLYNDTNATLASHYAVSSSEEYYQYVNLKAANSFTDDIEMNWPMAACLLLAWGLTFLCLIKGIKSAGKVVYFTATFPYVMLLILLIRGLTLPGHEEGILYYVKPDLSRLSDGEVWKDAASQVFFSLSVGSGGLATLASYNKFHNNVRRDTLIVALGNCATSVFAGFVIFSILGYMAQKQGVSVENVASGGFGLAFVAYPEALASMPGGPIWSFVFFFMLLILGIDSELTLTETSVTAICDEFPKLRKKKVLVLFCLCFMMFLIGLLCSTNFGFVIVDLMDVYGGTYPLVFIGLFEVLVVCYVYGFRKFQRNIKSMIGGLPLMPYWLCNWLFVTPVLLIFSLVYSFMDYTRPAPLSNMTDVESDVVTGLSWGLFGLVFLPLPIFMIYTVTCKSTGSLGERFKQSWMPLPSWGPYLPKHREQERLAAEEKSRAYIIPRPAMYPATDAKPYPTDEPKGEQNPAYTHPA